MTRSPATSTTSAAATWSPDGPKGNTLYIGSANQAQGGKVFADNAQSCLSLIHTRVGMLARPAALMSNRAATGGTLLSWKPTANASSYSGRAGAADQCHPRPQADLRGQRTPFDDSMPRVSTPGAPGAGSGHVEHPGRLLPRSPDTTKPYYVDASSGRYLPSTRSWPTTGWAPASPVSNVESSVKDSADAPASFAAASAALAPASASSATVARFRADAVHGSAAERLLLSAREAMALGHPHGGDRRRAPGLTDGDARRERQPGRDRGPAGAPAAVRLDHRNPLTLRRMRLTVLSPVGSRGDVQPILALGRRTGASRTLGDGGHPSQVRPAGHLSGPAGSRRWPRERSVPARQPMPVGVGPDPGAGGCRPGSA